jgi:hypothetical protein
MTVFTTKTLKNGDIKLMDGKKRAATVISGTDLVMYNDDHIFDQPDPPSYGAKVRTALELVLVARDAKA